MKTAEVSSEVSISIKFSEGASYLYLCRFFVVGLIEAIRCKHDKERVPSDIRQEITNIVNMKGYRMKALTYVSFNDRLLFDKIKFLEQASQGFASGEVKVLDLSTNSIISNVLEIFSREDLRNFVERFKKDYLEKTEGSFGVHSNLQRIECCTRLSYVQGRLASLNKLARTDHSNFYNTIDLTLLRMKNIFLLRSDDYSTPLFSGFYNELVSISEKGIASLEALYNNLSDP